jgi:prevent-host-death family protein
MSTTVNMHEAKTHFSKLVALALAGEEVIVARAGKPQVKLVPVTKAVQTHRPIGLGKDEVVIHDSFFDPLPDWEDLTA